MKAVLLVLLALLAVSVSGLRITTACNMTLSDPCTDTQTSSITAPNDQCINYNSFSVSDNCPSSTTSTSSSSTTGVDLYVRITIANNVANMTTYTDSSCTQNGASTVLPCTTTCVGGVTVDCTASASTVVLSVFAVVAVVFAML